MSYGSSGRWDGQQFRARPARGPARPRGTPRRSRRAAPPVPPPGPPGRGAGRRVCSGPARSRRKVGLAVAGERPAVPADKGDGVVDRVRVALRVAVDDATPWRAAMPATARPKGRRRARPGGGHAVAQRVAGQRQFGRDQQPRPCGGGAPGGVVECGKVALDGPGPAGGALEQRNAQRRHGTSDSGGAYAGRSRARTDVRGYVSTVRARPAADKHASVAHMARCSLRYTRSTRRFVAPVLPGRRVRPAPSVQRGAPAV